MIYLLARLDHSNAAPTAESPVVEPPPPTLPATQLEAPTLVVTAVGTTSITLDWNDVTDAVSYRLYQSVDNVAYVQIAVLSVSGYQVLGLAAGTYYFRARAVDADGALSVQSNTVAQSVAGVPVDTTPPNVPTGLVVTAFTETSISFSWGAVVDAVTYRVYRSTDGVSYSQIDTTVTASYVASGLSIQLYFFKVSAVDAAGNVSALSEPVSQMTVDLTPPAVPQNLRVTGKTETTIALAWDASQDVAFYRVYQSANGVSFSSIATEPGLSVVMTGLNPASTYYFAVTALDVPGNESERSDVVSDTTLAVDLAPDPPTGVVCTLLTNDSLRVSFNANTELDLHHYKVYRSTNGVNFALYASGQATFLNETSLALDTRFYYYVTAVDNALNESDPSVIVSGRTSQFTLYDASFRTGLTSIPGNPNLLPAHLNPLEAGDKYRLNGAITPAGAATVTIGDGGYVSATFIPQSTVPTYTGILIGTAVSTTGSGSVMTVSAPVGVTGDGTWKLILVGASFGANDAITLAPAGFNNGADSPLTSLRTWERVATGSDTTTLAFSGGSAKVAYMFAVKSPAGWPTAAVGDVSPGQNSSVSAMVYNGASIGGANRLAIQVGARVIPTPTGLPTGVDTTVGYSPAGFALGVTGASNYVVISAQIFNGDASGTGLPANSVAITGNADSSGSKRVSFTLRGNSDTTYVPITIPLFRIKHNGVGGTEGVNGEDGMGGKAYFETMTYTP